MKKGIKKITIVNAKKYVKTKETFEFEGGADLEASDEYHTFSELYKHRIALFIVLAKTFSKKNVWRSKLHSDGTKIAGWFILGIFKKKGQQITYHLPLSKWNETEFAETLEKAPEFDGHTSNDVLKRLKLL